jgi:uncharacterized DUF497 family protein
VDEPWDQRKARLNLRKHGVSFDEAATVERDRWRIMWLDEEHSVEEDRYHLLGMSSRGRTLQVTGTIRHGRIRPITARRATKRERHEYGSGPR